MGDNSQSGDRGKLAHLLQEALPIAFYMPVGKGLGPLPSFGSASHTYVPLLFVETDRPDLHDLCRVHRIEGDGDVKTRWHSLLDHNPAIALLEVTLTNPVTTRFVLKFEIPKDAEPLAVIYQEGIALFSTDREVAAAFRERSPRALYLLATKEAGIGFQVDNGPDLHKILEYRP